MTENKTLILDTSELIIYIYNIIMYLVNIDESVESPLIKKREKTQADGNPYRTDFFQKNLFKQICKSSEQLTSTISSNAMSKKKMLIENGKRQKRKRGEKKRRY